MNGFNPADIMEGIARKAIANQERRPGDFINDEGFLVCGVCKAQRQRFMDVADPTPDDPNHTRRMKVTTLCECEKEEERMSEDDVLNLIQSVFDEGDGRK